MGSTIMATPAAICCGDLGQTGTTLRGGDLRRVDDDEVGRDGRQEEADREERGQRVEEVVETATAPREERCKLGLLGLILELELLGGMGFVQF